MVTYTNVSTNGYDVQAPWFYAIEGLFITVFNGILFGLILKTETLRVQKEYLIYACCMFFDILFGLTYFSSGVFRLLIIYNNDFIPSYSRWECFCTPGVILFAVITPGAGYITLFTTLDRVFCIFYPLRYRKMSTKYAVKLIVLIYFSIIPTFIWVAVGCYLSTDGKSQPMTCNQPLYLDVFMAQRTIRISCTIASVLLYTPLVLKMYKSIKHHRKVSDPFVKVDNKIRQMTLTVALITSNTFILFTVPDIILLIMPTTSSSYFYLMNLNKGVMNIIVFLATQKRLRELIWQQGTRRFTSKASLNMCKYSDFPVVSSPRLSDCGFYSLINFFATLSSGLGASVELVCTEMRWLLICAIALLALANAAPSENKWTKVFSAFFPNAPHTYADNYLDDISEPTHVRVRRAVYAALGITSMCSAGWTGQFCENPVCTSPSSPENKDVNNAMKMLDMIYLPSGCSGNYYIPYDSMSTGMAIQVITSDGSPTLNLTNAAGDQVTPTGKINSFTHALYMYKGLAPGKYQMVVDNGGVPTTHCVATVDAESTVAVGTAFVDNAQGDSSYYGVSCVEGRLQNLVVHPFNLPPGAQAASASIFIRAPNNGPMMRSLLTRRYNCGFEYFVGGTFACSHLKEYSALIEGIDNKGFNFRRIVPFGCTIVPSPPTTTTPPVIVNQCYNGGTIINKGTTYATCICPTLFTGAQCQEAQCMNGGSQLPEKLSCQCPIGYSGNNCEQVNCRENVGQYLTDSKSFIVVVRAVQSMNQYINTIVAKIDAEYQYMSNFDAYKQFVLVTYANGDYNTRVFYPSGYNTFLSTVAALNATATVGNCTDVTVTAIADIFKQLIYNKSPIYIFTDAPASDYDSWLSVTEANAMRKLPIFPIFMNTTAAQTCNVDEMSAGYRVMNDLAVLSGGLVLVPSNDKFGTTLSLALRSTTYKMNQVLIDDLSVCKVNGYRTFFADSATKHIVIMATGGGLNLMVTDPKGKKYQPTLFQDGYNYFYTIPTQNISIGEYLLNLSSTQPQYPCSFRIYAHSDYDLFFGTTGAVFDDVTFSEPVYGKSRALVAQLSGFNVADQFRLFSEVTVWSNEDGQTHKPLYFGNGAYRSGCGFHLYFGYTNFCEYVGQMFYATVYADDINGFTIQRTTVGYCAGSDTTPSPPTSCVNGGVTNPNNATQCICPPQYMGQYCEQLVCQNGGLYRMGRCECPAGTGGTFCEEYQCTQTQPGLDFTYSHRTMNFVVSVRSTMQDVWTKLAAGAPDFVRDIQLHSPNWINKWNLILAEQSNATLIKSTSSSQGFVDAIQEIAANLQNYNPEFNSPNCSIALTSGIYIAAQNSAPGSYIFSWSDSDSNQDALNYLRVLANVEANKIKVNLIETNPVLCSDSKAASFSPQLQELAAFSNGWFYNSGDVAEMLNFIVTEYQSGVSSDKFYLDCTKPQTFYVPVDGWTQSMTMIVVGNKPTVTVTLPDGSFAKNGNMEINMINNDATVLNQYIIPCDSVKWVTRNSYCYLYEINMKNYLDSSQMCKSESGFVVDIHNQAKQDFVSYEAGVLDVWLGLIRNNGQWYWDVPNQHDPLQLGSYTNWAAGVNLNDPNKTCAILRGADGKWVPADCSEAHYSICQKHRYGQDIYPGDATTNLLPPGFWKVQVSTSSGQCSIQTRAQSQVQVFFGYVQDPHSDYPELYANTDATNNYVSAVATGLSPWHSDRNPSLEGRLNYVYMGFNGSALDALTFQDRSRCSFQMLSQNFSCIGGGAGLSTFFVKFSGIDQYGYTFERISNSYCGLYHAICYNGGYHYQGLCVCTEGWNGDKCQNPVCLNGGIPQADHTCKCEPMYTGSHCQHAMCEPPYPATFTDTGRTLAIAVEQSSLMGSTLFMLKKNLQKIITQLNAQNSDTAGWFNEFILYPFDAASNKASWPLPTITDSLDELIKDLKAIPNGCPGGSCSNFCPRPYVKVIKDLLGYPYLVRPNSQILVITRTSPEDYDLLNEVTDNLIRSKAKINFLFPTVSSPCSEGWDTPEARAIIALSSYSGGSIFTLTAPEITNTWLPQYFPSTFKGANVEGGQRRDCKNAETYFQVENSAYEFTINYFASSISMTLFNPMGSSVSLPPSLLSSPSNYLGVISVNETGATMAGTYKLVTNSDDKFCAVDIRIRSGIEIYPAYTQVADAHKGATQDDAHFEPLIGDNNIVLVHADGLPEFARIEYAQIVAPRRGGLIFTSEMRRRDKGCSYEYYSTKSFECYMDEFLLIISGTDDRGAAFSRQFVGHCLDSRPRPPPPTPWCDLTKTKNDIVFLVDASLTAGEEIFGVFKIFMNHVITGFGVGQNTTQVGVLALSNSVTGHILLNSCEDLKCATDRISALKPDLFQGQNLTSGLQYINELYTKPSQGYRVDNTVRHNIVYLTASNSYTDGAGQDPVSLVYNIKRGGAFGFTIVGLKVTPQDYMMSMANELCSYYAKDMNDIGTNGVNFLQSLSCYRYPICGI